MFPTQAPKGKVMGFTRIQPLLLLLLLLLVLLLLVLLFITNINYAACGSA